MKALAALAAAVFVGVLAWNLSQPIVERWSDDNATRREAAALELERQRIDLQNYETRQALALPARILADYGLVLLLGGAALGLAWIVRDAYRARRVPLVRYAAGLPVPRHMIEYGDERLLEMMAAALQLDGAAAIERARASANVPTSYAPHVTVARPERLEPQASAPAQLTGATAAPALPDEAPLSSVREKFEPGRIIYGVMPGGDPLVLTYGASYHGLAAGDTRTGKSNWLDSIICQLHYHATERNIRLWIADYKREMASTWSRSPLPSAIETDPARIAEMLVELANGRDGILQRYTRFKAYGEKHGRIVRNLADYVRASGHYPQITFCVVDELNALIEACDEEDELASALKIVLQLGAGAGIYVLSGAQYLTAKTFGRDGSKQFTTRALFGPFDQTAAGMLFGHSKLAADQRALLTGIPGRGLIRTTGHALPSPFQALHAEESDILAAIEHYRSHRGGALEDKQPAVEISASEAGISDVSEFTRDAAPPQNPRENEVAAEAAEVLTNGDSPQANALTSQVSATYEPRLFYGVAALRATGASKSAIIKTLWKVTGGPPWQKASAEYESIVAALESEVER